MGGYGSGKTGDGRTTASGIAFDVRMLHRRGWIHTGHTGRMTWYSTYNGVCRRQGEVSFQVDGGICFERGGARASAVHFTFQTCAPGEAEGRKHKQTAAVEWTRCAKGGERPWLRCPDCARRCALLYIPAGGRSLACRLCWGRRTGHPSGLPYPSQHEKPEDRLLTKAIAIRERVGQKGGGIMEPFPAKPKGMHWSTYERLHGACRDAELMQWRIVAGQFGFA